MTAEEFEEFYLNTKAELIETCKDFQKVDELMISTLFLILKHCSLSLFQTGFKLVNLSFIG